MLEEVSRRVKGNDEIRHALKKHLLMLKDKMMSNELGCA